MHRDIEWMVPADRYILEHLQRAGRQTPSCIAMNIGYGSHHVGVRCREELLEYELVEKYEAVSGAYEITEKGRELLDGSLDPEEIESSG